MATLARWGLRAKAPLLTALLCVGALRAWCGGPMGSGEGSSVAAVARVLSRSTDARFSPDELAIVTRPGGWLEDAALGRVVVGLGRPRGQRRRDLYLADVRFGPSGRPYGVAWWRNVTQTPDADESEIVVADGRAAFAVKSAHGVEDITVVDMRGEGPAEGTWLDGFFAGAQAWQDTGLVGGVRRLTVDLDQAMRAPHVALRGRRLAVNEGRRHIAIDLVRPPERTNGARVLLYRRPPRSPVIWLVDTLREVVGKAPIAWLESTVFNAQDRVRSWTYRASSDSGGVTDEPLSEAELARAQAAATVGTATTTRTRRREPVVVWPPAPVLLRFRNGEPGEGVWHPAAPAFVRQIPGAPQFAFSTFVRPDPERPYVRVDLLALDPRQVEIGMQAGTEDPRPTTGAPGEGRIPRDPELLARVVAAFNGAFKSEHGNYGMQVDGRLFLPPQPGAATLATYDDGRLGFGTWGESSAVPAAIRSFRQNMTPLVDGDRVNPAGRRRWGWVLGVAGAGEMPTERTALCLHRDGYVLFAWGQGVTGTGLGEATHLAGCTYTVHLDMNPIHCVWEWLRVEGTDVNHAQHAYLAAGMRGTPRRFLRWFPKDFFYLTLRRAGPPQVTGSTLVWRSNGLPQPGPDFLPAVWQARGDRVGGPPVNVVSVGAGRATWVTRPGRRDDQGRGAGPRAGSIRGALLALEISAPRRAGFRSGGADLARFDPSMATVVLGAHPRVLRPGSDPGGAGDELLQGELVLADGELVEGGNASTWERAAGIGITRDGRIVVAAAGRARLREIAAVLREAGADEAVAFPGPDGARGFVRIASEQEPLRPVYDGRAIFVVPRALLHPTFRFDQPAR